MLQFPPYPRPAVANLPDMPAEAGGPPIISFDVAGLGSFVSQQIPAAAIEPVAGSVAWSFNGGRIGISPGTSGEGDGAYVRGSRSANLGVAWTPKVFFQPRLSTHSMLDPQTIWMSDGRLLILLPYSGGSQRAVWGIILNNPLASSGHIFSAWYFLGFGFTGRPAYIGSDLRVCFYEPVIGLSPPYASWQGKRLYRIVVEGNSIRTVLISVIPQASPEATLNDYDEPSIMRRGAAGGLCNFRTQATDYEVASSDDMATWGTPVAVTSVNSNSTRSLILVAPNGWWVRIGNNSTSKREKMTVWVSLDEGVTYPYRLEIDSRGSGVPRPSYPTASIYGDLRLFGQHDCGRGTQDGPTYTNQILSWDVSLREIVAGTAVAPTLYAQNS